ncbi:MAG: T9SS C-terminal target domain-containing protein [Calditrichaeota bacterium]|nr:MAG: T9SS C-terminal target domain-containing protein [Calditrichota bacterium]
MLVNLSRRLMILTLGLTVTYQASQAETTITPSDNYEDNYFGEGLDIDGDFILSGASLDSTNGDNAGAVYSFERIGTNWVEQEKFVGSDTNSGDYFGCSVKKDGDFAIVGASGKDNSTGAAYIFMRNSTGSWIEVEKMEGENSLDGFGCDVAISGNYAIVGAFGVNSTSSSTTMNWNGAVYVYEKKTPFFWKKIAVLKPTATDATAKFGASVDIDGNNIVVGACGEYYLKGAVYIYEIKNDSVDLVNKFYGDLNSSSSIYSRFGSDVEIDGDVVLASSASEEIVAVFEKKTKIKKVIVGDSEMQFLDVNWETKTILTPNSSANDFGKSIAISGDNIFIASNSNGHFFKKVGTNWVEQLLPINANLPNTYSSFGRNVAIDGDHAISNVLNVFFYPTYSDSEIRVYHKGAYFFTKPTNDENTPKVFSLSQNYPNPFNPSTKIDYELEISNLENSSITIFNILGEKVKEFTLNKEKGSVVWDGKDSFGNLVSSGNYFYRLTSGDYSHTKKMTFLK